LTHIEHSEKVLVMKVFLTVLILVFNLQSWSKADEIRNIEIEGMTIEDSALNYFSNQEIENNKKKWFKNDKYSISVMRSNKFVNYDKIQIVYKTTDTKKKLVAIDGLQDYEDIKLCNEKLDDIAEEISSVLTSFKNLGKLKYKNNGDPSGKSTVIDINFENENQDEIQVACYDYSEEFGGNDHLRVGIRLLEYRHFLRYDAY